MVYNQQSTNGTVSVVKNEQRQFAVIDSFGHLVVPFGKYEWIDAFDRGFARVRTKGRITYTKNTVCIIDLDNDSGIITDQAQIHSHVLKEREEHPECFSKWGIINEDGEEVLPLEYDEIWNFKNKMFDTTIVEKNGVRSKVFFRDLQMAGGDNQFEESSSFDNYDYSRHYGEYAGSYAQDVMGFDDDTIGDAFEGDPDAYWNID